MKKQIASKNKYSIGTAVGWIIGIFFLLIGVVSLFSIPESGFISILAGLAIFPPFWKFANNKWNFTLAKKYKILLFVGFLFLGGLTNHGNTTSSNSTSSEAVTKNNEISITPTDEPKQPLTLEEKIKAALPDSIKDADVTITDASEITDGAPTDNLIPGKKAVLLSVKLGDGFWDLNMAKEGVWRLSTLTFKNLFPTDDSIYSITLMANMPTTDAYGKKGYDMLETVTITRDTYQKIDFANFDPKNIPTIADIYVENKNIK